MSSYTHILVSFCPHILVFWFSCILVFSRISYSSLLVSLYFHLLISWDLLSHLLHILMVGTPLIEVLAEFDFQAFSTINNLSSSLFYIFQCRVPQLADTRLPVSAYLEKFLFPENTTDNTNAIHKCKRCNTQIIHKTQNTDNTQCIDNTQYTIHR